VVAAYEPLGLVKTVKFDVLLTGVGGEGVLTTQVVIARAANLERYFVRGLQLHGLAQRGGTLQTIVRFGDEKEIFSPAMMPASSAGGPADANLILAFEPLEAVRAVYYARKEKTVFVIDDEPLVPIYAYLLRRPYPEIKEIEKRLTPFAKNIYFVPASQMAKKECGDPVFGNTVLLGAAHGLGTLPLKKENLIEALKISAPRDLEKNLAAFKAGVDFGKKVC